MERTLFQASPPLRFPNQYRWDVSDYQYRCRTFEKDPRGCMSTRVGRDMCSYRRTDRKCVKISHAVKPHFGCKDGHRNAPRVAVCLAGLPRTFARAHVHGSLSRQILWQRADAGSQVDLFAVLSAGSGDSIKKQDGWNTSTVAFDTAAVAKALASLEPRVVHNVHRHFLQPRPSCNVSAQPYMVENHARVLAKPSTWALCYDHIARAEREDDMPYDWIVVARPDAFWYGAHPRLCKPVQTDGLPPIVLNAPPYVDNHFVLPRATAFQIMRHMAIEYNACTYSWPFAYLEPWLFAGALETAMVLNTTVERWEYPFTLVRNSSSEPFAGSMGCNFAPVPAACLALAYPDET
jgi:hypothetical protein